MYQVSSPADVPDGKHYAILIFEPRIVDYYYSTSKAEVAEFVQTLKPGSFAVLDVSQQMSLKLSLEPVKK